MTKSHGMDMGQATDSPANTVAPMPLPAWLADTAPAARSVPVTTSWINPVSGDWNDGGDWSSGAAPGVFSRVAIRAAGSYTVTVDTFSAASAVTVAGAGTTLAIGGSGTLTIGTDIRISGATLALSNGGSLAALSLTMGPAAALTASGTSTVAAALDIAAGVTLAAGSLLQLQDGGTISGLVSGAGTLGVDGGNLTVAAADLAAGTVLLQAGTLVAGNAGGTLNETFVLDGGTLSLAATTTATLTAPLTLNSGAQLDLSGTAIVTGAISLDTGARLNAGNGTAGSGSVTLDGAVSVSGGATIGGDVTTNGELIFGLSTGYDGAGGLGFGTLITNGITIVNEAPAGSGPELSVYGTWTNAGTVYDRGLVYDQGSIINAAGGNFYLFDDAAAVASQSAPGGSFSNAGTLARTSGTGTSSIFDAVRNSGLIDVLSGELDLAGGGVLGGRLAGAGTLALGGIFTTTLGVLNTAHGVDIVVNGTLALIGASGTLTNALTWDNATLAVDVGKDVTINAAGFVDGTSVGFGGPGTITTMGILAGSGLTLSRGVTWVNTGDATANGIGVDNADTRAISIVNELGATLTLAPGASVGLYDTKTKTADTLTNAGTLVVGGSGLTSTLDITLDTTGEFDATGFLTLADGGTLGGIVDITAATNFAAGNFYLSVAALANVPYFSVDVGANVHFADSGAISAPVFFDGTFSLASGAEVALSSLNGVNSGAAGLVSLADGSVLNIESNLVIGKSRPAAGLTVSGPGTFSTAGDITLENTGARNPPADLLLDNGATWTNSGSVAINGSIAGDSSASDSVTIINQTGGVMTLGYGQTIGATGGGTLQLTNAGTIATGGTPYIDVALTNTGLVSDTGGNDYFYDVTTTNNGTISVATGTLSIGSIAGTGILLIGNDGALITSGAQAGQTVDFAAGAASLYLSAPLDFLGTVSGFGAGDLIDLQNAHETGFAFSGGVLTIMDDSAIVASLDFNGAYTASSFSVTNNNVNVLINFKS